MWPNTLAFSLDIERNWTCAKNWNGIALVTTSNIRKLWKKKISSHSWRDSIKISMKFEEGFLALSHSHYFERHVLKSRQKESQEKVMMKDHNSSKSFSSNDRSALATKWPNSQHFDLERRSNRPWCDHCNRVGHTRETYWKIYGKPSNWKSNKT